MDKTAIKELRAVEPLKFRHLVLKAFPKFLLNFYIEKERPFNSGYNFIVTNTCGKDLVHVRQDKSLIDSGFIRKLCDFLKMEKVNRVFLITTGIVKISDKSFLEDRPVETIDARRLVEFLSITLGEEGLQKELNAFKERRECPRLDLTQEHNDGKVCLRAETLYQTRPDIGESNISAIGAGVKVSASTFLPGLFRLELVFGNSPTPIKVLAKTIWQRQKVLGVNEAGLRFFLIKDNDRERISEFVRVRKVDKEVKSDNNMIESDSHKNYLLEVLVGKGILKRIALNAEERGIEMNIEKVNLRAQRFLRKMFQRKNKILDTHKTESGWEVWARLIDDYFKRLGYRDVYEKKIYIVKLDENFKVFGYTVASEKHFLQATAPQKKEKPVSMDKAAIKEAIKEIIKETLPKKETDSQLLQDIIKEMNKEKASVDISPEALKRIAKEVASHISSVQDESKQMAKPKAEDIKIRESFINPSVGTKMDYNFKRLGTVAKSRSKISKQVKSFRNIRKKEKSKSK